MVVSLVLQWWPACGEPGGVGMIVDDCSDDSLVVWVDDEEEVAALSRLPSPMADKLPPPLPAIEPKHSTRSRYQ
ncbi:Hypothetical predicted protein [Cloeon dipterum]|uniref:Uncharacterized protein n=1 Tax=Cloeon dipterum TaxID=197152 RepID=A0A8S1D609_9INSE|nr:Hypothetical predicted protein [Cloeon dipterum]